jgi:CRP/FNR family cyclic AMP-dependent transcriptional regulator
LEIESEVRRFVGRLCQFWAKVNIFVDHGSDRNVSGLSPGWEKSFMPSTTLTRNNRDFDPKTFLGTSGKGRKVVTFMKEERIFTQGDAAGVVFYIQKGKVRHTVVSRFGKEEVLEILGKGEFFGDGGLAGQPLRMGTATAITDCKLLQIDKDAMIAALHRDRAFLDLFVAYLLARNTRYHEKLVEQLFDSSEVRLARTLLLLAHFGEEGPREAVIPKVSQKTLAGMAGTTRLRVRFLMNRFRKAGFLAYGGNGMQIHRSLLNVILNE